MIEYNDQKPKKSGLATASLILSITGFITCGITSVVGLVLGIISLVQISRSNGSMTGQKLAVAGVIVSAIGVILIPVFFLTALMFPVFNKAREQARTVGCLSHLKEIGIGASMYASDHDGALPGAENWVELVSAYLPDKGAFRCPSAGSDENAYAMNSKMSRIKVSAIRNPSDTIMIFDSIPGINQNGGIELMPSPGRHLTTVSKYNFESQQNTGNNPHGESSIKVNNIGFADGHMKSVTVEDAASLIWNPAQK